MARYKHLDSMGSAIPDCRNDSSKVQRLKRGQRSMVRASYTGERIAKKRLCLGQKSFFLL